MNSPINLAIKEIEDAFSIQLKRSKSWINVADKYLKFYRTNGSENHYTSEDIVMELIDKILSGERNWDPERVPDFDQYMFQNIQSLVEGKFRKRKVVESVESFEPVAKTNKTFKGLLPGQYVEDHDVGDLIDINERLEKCYNDLCDDDECGVVFLEMLKGKSSIEIAEYLYSDVAEIERIKKRIRYKLNHRITKEGGRNIDL